MEAQIKILVIDDDRDFIKVFRILFSKEPYEIIEAFDGKEGLCLVREHQPDLVLIDRVMPGMDGYEVCRQIKSKPEQHGIFVVLVSGMKTATDHLANGFESGADGYLTKPIPDRELRARINAYARIIRSEKALRKSEEMFRHIFENSPVGKSITGIDGSMRVNMAFCEMLGYSREELLHKNWKEITHPDDIEKSDEAVKLLLENKIDKTVFEKRYIHKNGQDVWAEVSTTIQKDENANPKFFITSISNITNRKHSEHQFKALSARNEAILSSVPDIIMEVDNNKVYTWANQAGLEFFGQDVIGNEASFFFEGEQSTYKKVEAVFQGHEQIIYVESWQRRKDGEKRLLAWWCRTLRDDKNKVTGALSTARDITEERLREIEIRNNESRFRSLVNILQHSSSTLQGFLDFALNEAIKLSDSKLGYIYFYDEEKKEFLLNSWSKEVMHACTIPNPPKCYELEKTGIWGEAVRQRKPIILNDFQQRHPLKKGYPAGHAVLKKFMTIPVFHNGLIVAVVGIANKEQDYSETDVLQLTLLMETVWKVVMQKRVEIALHDSEEKFRNLFDTMAQGVVYQDENGVIFSANPAAQELLGLTLDQLKGMTSMDPRWKSIHEDGSAFPGETHPIMIARKTGEKVKNVIMGVYNPIKEHYTWLLISATPQFRDNEVKPYQCFATFMDITELKMAQQAITDMNLSLEKRVSERTAELQISNKELEAFSYSVSHDLRAPLRSLNGFAQILMEEHANKLDEEGLRLLKVISNNAKKMGELIDGLLSFSRLNRYEIRHEQTDMEKIAREVFMEATAAVERAKIDFSLDLLPVTFGDPILLRQVWYNLISNALKFSSPRPKRKIEIGYFKEKDEVVYFVKDNGVGFDMEYAHKLFNVFQRLHSPSEFEGTGVGLAIVHRIISRHNGRVWAESEPDKGSIFYFTLTQKKSS